jgi:precorrin-6Y C5,15-methyltransferase (decarboxylating)
VSELLLIGLCGTLTMEQKSLLKDATLIVAAPRLLPDDGCGPAARFQAITPLDAAMTAIRLELRAGGAVAVLASGDPMFFGLGKRLCDEFADTPTRVLPSPSSLQLACARWRIAWHDARIISLHGRALAHVGELLRHGKTIVLTDKNNSPDRLAASILDYFKLIGETELPQRLQVLVGENLALPDENISRLTLTEAAARRFAALNVVCFYLPEAFIRKSPFIFGLSEEHIEHVAGMITKNEVRAAVLHALRLPRQGIFWDVGGGSGSVSIEAAGLAPCLAIYTIERCSERMAAIKENIRRYQRFSITPILGEAPAALAALPDPDRVFVGGGGAALPDIVTAVHARLKPGGRLVLTAVSERSIQTAPDLLKSHGFATTVCEIRVTRRQAHGDRILNPITIITGEK